MKFRADVSGTICGLRFYKGGTQNGGTHEGHVWTSGGQLLASATFTNETASGWQQVNFATPVQIAANTVYIASYTAPQGRYAEDNNYFANAGIDNGPLHVLQDGVSGGNGVYLYGTGGFPTNSHLSSNYWVDVVFSADVVPPATAINDLFLFRSGIARTVNYAGPLGLGVLANDTDPGDQPLSAVVVGTLPTGVTLASNGVVTINRTSAAFFNYRTDNGTQLSQPASGAFATLAIDGAPTAVVENCTYTRAGAGSVSGAACAMVGASTFTMNLKANDTDPDSATNVPVDSVGRTVTGANITATSTGVAVSANAACGQAAIVKTASRATVTNNCDGTVRVVVSAGALASPITLTYGAIDDLGAASATANRTTDTVTVQ
jgi:hypothetical protein